MLRVNLDKPERVFPFVVTCGTEIEEASQGFRDILEQFCLDELKQMALGAASSYLRNHVKRKYLLGKTSSMSPGSLEDWPITQQKELFSIFGNVKELIGVELTDSFLMVPIKSVSGVIFPTEITFESCQLCQREGCPGRRAPYDAHLEAEYFGAKK